jgi:cell division septation protein DedD
VPNPPEPAAQAVSAQAIDPRIHQLAARDALAPVPLDDGADAVPASPPAGARLEPSVQPLAPVPEIPDAIDRFDNPGNEVPTTPPADRLATLDDTAEAGGPAGAGPLPPPVPRSIAATGSGWPAASSSARYSVQVGAFRMRENAVERAARLSEAGYEVRIVHAFATHSRLYMVRLGAFDARPAAIAYARRLARDVGVETWPVRN